MSGFAAIVRFDGAPVDKLMLARMLDAIDYRGLDGRREWTNGQVAIGHLMLHTTAESLSETQPLSNEDGSLVLAMDGWLANPAELRSGLAARGAVLRTGSDAELLLRAYETWGDECPKHVDGEYAFLLWDGRRREFVCMKDHVGMRPLHYHWDGRRLLVASDLAGVLAAGDFEPRPNMGMMAEHLADTFYTPDETLWENVMRLCPAHRLRASHTGLLVARYWVPAYVPAILYKSDDDYQEHYRDLLTDVVRRASRTHRPLACDVSGGLDSSAIFAVAHRLQAEGMLNSPSLKGYTVYFGPDADPSIDEISFARAVARHLGVEVKEVNPFLPPLDWFAATAKADRDMPPYPHSTAGLAIGHALLTDGCRVDLNGEGGDEAVGAPPYYYAQYLAKANLSLLGTAAREDYYGLGSRETLRRILQYGIRPLIPGKIARIKRKMASRRLPTSRGSRLLSGPLKKVLNERRGAASTQDWIAALDPHRRLMMMRLDSAFSFHMKDNMSRGAARLGFERRSPFLSREIIEFGFAVPSRQFTRGRQTKRFHRAAMINHLPQTVLDRTSKSLGGAAFSPHLDKIDEEMLEPFMRCGIDIVDVYQLRSLLEYDIRLPITHRAIFELWAIFGCGVLFAQWSEEYRRSTNEYRRPDQA